MSEDVQTLLQKLDECDGEEVYQHLTSLKRGAQICNQNYTELSNTAQEFESNTEDDNCDIQDTVELFILEISRHLHNFISSTYSVYNYTKTIENKFFTDEKNNIIDKQKRVLGDRAPFLTRIRAFMQKTRLPEVKCRERKDSVEQYRDWKPNTVFYLEKTELENWDDWNSRAEKYLASLDRDIDIVGEMAAYEENFREYNQWFINFLRDSYRQEIEERNKIVQSIKRAADSSPS